jgi:hypothetical protein
MPPEPVNRADNAVPTIRKHIFISSGFSAMRVEDPDALANLKADLVALYQPVNSQELFAIERIALAQHSLTRTYRIEAGLVTLGLEAALDVPGVPPIMKNREITNSRQITGSQNHNYWMASGFHQMLTKSSDWQLLLRYQAQCERMGRRATEEFERLRALRGVLPEQTLIEPEPAPEAVMPPPPQATIADPPDLPVPEPADPIPAANRPRKVRCIRPGKVHPFNRRKQTVTRIRATSPPDSS